MESPFHLALLDKYKNKAPCPQTLFLLIAPPHTLLILFDTSDKVHLVCAGDLVFHKYLKPTSLAGSHIRGKQLLNEFVRFHLPGLNTCQTENRIAITNDQQRPVSSEERESLCLAKSRVGSL